MSDRNQKNYFLIECLPDSVKSVKMKLADHRFQLIQKKCIQVDSPVNERNYQRAILESLKGENLKSKQCYISVQSLNTCFSSFTLPRLPKKEVPETLKLKMKSQIPFSVDNAVMDFRVYDMQEDGVSNYLALVTATPPESVDHWARLIPPSKLRYFDLVTVPFEMNVLMNLFAIPRAHNLMVIDLGDSFTEIQVYSQGRLSFLRKILFGKESLIGAMTQPLVSEKERISVSHEEAELVLQSENLFVESDSRIAGKVSAKALYQLVLPEFEKLIVEIQRSADCFLQQQGKSVSQIYITGLLSDLKGLYEYLSNTLNRQISRLDLARVVNASENGSKLNGFYRQISLIMDKHGVDMAVQRRRTKKTRHHFHWVSYSNFLGSVMIIWLAIFGVLIGKYFEVDQKITAVKLETQNLEVTYVKSQNWHSRKGQLEREKRMIDFLVAKEPVWNKIFTELSNLFPEDVVLKDISFEGGSFVISGSSQLDEQSISEVISSIKGPVFKNVTLIKLEKTGNTTHFSAQCSLE